ncbi:probable RNA-directed DNA polymerase from transposon BS [Trichonephila clavipes]|uniref:Probable RNA-directed DNA polymerase from transposon BS n=1 Tax=Trichonephila clavipes TaxID=2585209 RepID=A0A8X6RFB2_TRICX|nr:probable RNA-directed DNA polymerase from transposon BS [Trichonephila clavipes]
MSILISQDIDVFIIVEANLSHDSLKLHTFGPYFTKILPKSRRITSGILVGVRKGLISDFHEISNLSSYNGAEIIKLDVWKRKRHFKVYGCYSPPGNTKLDFSLLTFTSKTILCGDFNAHSKRWNYSDQNSAGKVMEDLLIADQMELLYNDSDIPTYLHYNGNGTNPDLTLASADIADNVEREVIYDPGSGHRMIITGIGFDTSNYSKRPFRNRWNFAKADWKNFTLENETIFESVSSFCKAGESVDRVFSRFTRQRIIGREIRNIASSQSHGHEIFHRDFSISELREAVGHIRCAKSPGPDNFQPEFLKHLGCNALSVLLTLYNHSWKFGVPAIWKKAIVVPIPKKNKPLDDLNSYRPISLTSILSKVMERMTTSRLDWYLETNNLLSSSQAGFRKCQSTNQVVFLGQSIKDALDQRYSALALFVDFEAAFDKVWRLKCIQKLQTLGVCNNMLMWIRNFISQRFSAVRFGNAISSFKQSETGLPQGTVISPILFNIFINDLPDLLASDGLTNTALFADDLAIWCSTPKRDQSKLNTIINLTLERLHLWCIENNMTVNLKKTTCQFFTLNRQPFSPQLVYNGMPVQQSDVSIYLGCALDNKLKWTKHAELVVSKARKRLSILKRLTGVKWGCNRDTLNTTYKTYIQPVLNYCNEVLISASENVRKLLDTFHNQALRMITGGVKTTPVLAMQLLCDLQPFTNIIEKNAAILFNRLIRLPNNSFWRDYDSDGGRNLKTQKGFIQCVRKNIQYKVINDVPFELLSFANPLDYAILDIRLDLVLNVRKRDLSPTALHAIALETINTRFPPEEWLHIYTDGSLLDFAQGAGIGVFSHLFSFYLHAGPLTTHFDGEVEAIHIVLQQLAVRLPPLKEL